jgi:hypothetical protein
MSDRSSSVSLQNAWGTTINPSTADNQVTMIGNQPTALGDGEAIDLQDSDGTIGTTTWNVMCGRDNNNKARQATITWPSNDKLRAQSNSDIILKEVLRELFYNLTYKTWLL